MKKGVIVTVLIVVGLVGIFFVASSPSNDSGANAENSSKLTFDTVSADINNGSLLLDVRTPEEFSAGYIESAENLPLADIQSGQIPQISKDKPLYVYCRSGNRSAEATKLLQNAGFSNVIDLGGVNDVEAIGGNQVK
jgi:rhodanese-related sulfurtransferase